MNYTELKKRALERFFARSNDMQKKAIFRTEGAVLIIAGAGSGKTTVLCNRIANLLLFGDAYSSSYEPRLGEDDLAFLQACEIISSVCRTVSSRRKSVFCCLTKRC